MIALGGYIHKGRLCLVGAFSTKVGKIPFFHHTDLKGEHADGPISLDNPDQDPAIHEAYIGAEGPITGMVSAKELEAAVEDLVLRARAGEQNAQAILNLMRQNAQKGNPRAKAAFEYANEYVQDHPIDNPIGAEPKETVESVFSKFVASPLLGKYVAAIVGLVPSIQRMRATVILANGRELTADIVSSVAGVLPKTTVAGQADSQFSAFNRGFRHSINPNLKKMIRRTPPDLRSAMHLGSTMGLARRLQLVRRPETPIAIYSPEAGFELD